MATLEEIEAALRKADAAGNVEDAKRLADAYRQMRDGGAIKLSGRVPERPANPGISENIERRYPSEGLAMNATAGLNDALFTAAGAPVDLARGAINLGIGGFNRLTGAEVPAIPDDSFGGRKAIASGFERVGVRNPDSVVPANAAERIARGVGEGVGYTVGPQMAVGALNHLGALSGRAASTLTSMFGPSNSLAAFSGNAVAGGGAGAGAAAAQEVAPGNSLAAFGGGLVGGGAATLATAVPRVVQSGARLAGDFLRPLTAGGREQMAGRHLRDAATSPGAAIEALGQPAELVPGSKPTTFQQSGDMGLGQMERGYAARFPDEFAQRGAEQNAARVSTIEGMQAGGAPERVVTALKGHLRAIDDEMARLETNARGGARDVAGGLGAGRSPEVAGADMRAALETARAAAKVRERALWQAVDPDGTLALPAGNARQEVARIVQEMPKSAKPPSGEEAAIHGVLGRYGDVVPFSEVTALQSRIKTEMRAERIANGESAAYRRLSMLNSALERDIDAAVAGKVVQEQRAVDAGQMAIEDTLEFRWAQKRDEWLSARAERAAGDDGVASSRPNGRTGQASVSRPSGAERASGGGLGGAPRDPGLSPDAGGIAPNFDAAAQDRLNAARTATRERAETFDNKTLGPMRQRPTSTAPYDRPDAQVAQRVFNATASSPAAIRAYRNAVGDETALPIIRDFAIDRLRRYALNPDGTFDADKVSSWRRSHADALKAFPELDAQFASAAKLSETLAASVTARREAQAQAQHGAIGRLVGMDDPADVVRAVGSIFGRQDAATQMGRLAQAIGRDPEAREGLRRAVVDHVTSRFISNTEAGTSGVGRIKADQFQTFVARNKPALREAGFNGAEIHTMELLATDLQRANRSIASVRIPGGSNTAQDLLAVRAGDSGATLLVKALLSGGGTGAGVTALAGPVAGAGAGLAAAILVPLRQVGISKVDDLIKDALLNPERAKILMTKVPPTNAKPVATTIGQRYRRAVLAGMASGDDEKAPAPLRITVYGATADGSPPGQGVLNSLGALSN